MGQTTRIHTAKYLNSDTSKTYLSLFLGQLTLSILSFVEDGNVDEVSFVALSIYQNHNLLLNPFQRGATLGILISFIIGGLSSVSARCFYEYIASYMRTVHDCYCPDSSSPSKYFA